MSLAPGARIGIFEVVAKLGEGGMGQVYRARDLKLNRDVALKVLPPLFTSDAERLARFEREARVLASLNHPNIAQVYGFEANAIAMELVDGLTLDQVIADVETRSLDRVLPIMRQIAAALEAAHDQGIVHRDLKPANVKLREDGTVKVLDFGLAKALDDDASATSGVSNSPTLTARSTQLGMIIGTAAYMSPEQARGRAVDRRADVWAFGAVFFEMLAGRRAFEGDDVSDVLASVLKTEPDWSALPVDLPAPARRLLKRCLDKDPKRRLRDVSEGMLQLEEGLSSPVATASGVHASPAAADFNTAGAARPGGPLWRRAWPVAATAVLTTLAVLGITQVMTPDMAPPVPVRFTFEAGALPTSSGGWRDLAISPDGRTVVLSAIVGGRPSLHIRRLDQLGSAPLRGAEGAGSPFFSADSQWVGFVSTEDQNSVRKVPVLGGPAQPICKLGSIVAGAAWLPDGMIVVGAGIGPLMQVGQAGGTPEALTELDKAAGEVAHLWPSAVPGTSIVLFTIASGGRPPLTSGTLAAVDVKTRRTVRLKVPGSSPRYVASGHVAYVMEDGSLRAVRFDATSMSMSGTPAPVLDAVTVKPSGAANFDVSDDGRLIYGAGGGLTAERTIAWVDRTGKETPIAAPPRNYFYTRISPDGRRLSLDIRDREEDIWIWDVGRETMTRLTDKAGADQYGLWAGNDRVVFASMTSGRNELFFHRPDGVGQPEQITDTAAAQLVPFPNAITPDGRQVILRAAVNGKNDLFVADIGGDRKVRALLTTEHDERNASLSPDGKFMAFESDLSGRFEIYIRPFPDVNRRQWPVSTAGGLEPLWAANGREIVYVSGDAKLMTVSVTNTPELTLGKPAVLFDAGPYYFGGIGRNYDMTRDGARFAMVKQDVRTSSAIVVAVVLNWADELRAQLK